MCYLPEKDGLAAYAVFVSASGSFQAWDWPGLPALPHTHLGLVNVLLGIAPKAGRQCTLDSVTCLRSDQV